MKDGIKSTEFWVMLATTIVGILLAIGKLSPEQGAAISENASQIIGGVMAILAAFGYGALRTALKIKK